MERRCPRCRDAWLVPAAGAMQEDVCSVCAGRYLDEHATSLLCERHLRVSATVLKDLSHDGPRRLICPGCASRMTLTLLRGVQVDLCRGCGGAWLDEGELTRITRGQLPELGATALPIVPGAILLDGVGDDPGAAAPGTNTTTTSTTPVAMHGRRAIGGWEVRCTSCEEALDLGRTNWLINQRPWCVACASPYTGVSGALDIVMRIAGSLFDRRPWPFGGSLVEVMFGNVDALRIEPADAEQHFGPFFRPIGAPPTWR